MAGEDNTANVPPMLSNAWKTNKHGLPYSGGWAEHPIYYLSQMTAAENTYKAMKQWNAPGTKWGEFPTKYPHYWRIVNKVLELRKDEKRWR